MIVVSNATPIITLACVNQIDIDRFAYELNLPNTINEKRKENGIIFRGKTTNNI